MRGRRVTLAMYMCMDMAVIGRAPRGAAVGTAGRRRASERVATRLSGWARLTCPGRVQFLVSSIAPSSSGTAPLAPSPHPKGRSLLHIVLRLDTRIATFRLSTSILL